MNGLLEAHPEFVLVSGDRTKDGELVNREPFTRNLARLEVAQVADGLWLLATYAAEDLNLAIETRATETLTNAAVFDPAQIQALLPVFVKSFAGMFARDEPVADQATLDAEGEPWWGTERQGCAYDASRYTGVRLRARRRGRLRLMLADAKTTPKEQGGTSSNHYPTSPKRPETRAYRLRDR